MVVAHIRAIGLSLKTGRRGKARGESRELESNQFARDHSVAYHLAPAITDSEQIEFPAKLLDNLLWINKSKINQ